MAKEYSIFISHSWSYISDLENLRGLLEKRGYFNVTFEEASPSEPIDSENANYIKQRLRGKILNSNIVLGIAGLYASHSEWMQWEIDTAFNNDIPIVGVIPRGQINISRIVSSVSKEDVGWNTESIVSAIRRWSI